MTSYAKRPLIDKLGIRAGARVIILRAPRGYLDLMPELEERAEVKQRLMGPFDFIQYFATSREQLAAVLPNLTRHLQSDGMLWISWVKPASPLYTGLSENEVRALGVQAGLVDVKVAALTDDWSGLKFMHVRVPA